MLNNIKISQKSQDLINKYREAVGAELLQVCDATDLATLLSWLNTHPLPGSTSSKVQQQVEFILFSLDTELLNDLCHFLSANKRAAKKKLSSQDLIKFILLTGAGILVATCEGFDSVVTIMSIFSLPAALILASGVLFSVLSISAFCALDLVKLSSSLGIKLSQAPKVLNLYLRQLEQLKQIRKKIDHYNLSDLSLDELKQVGSILSMSEQRFQRLAALNLQFTQLLHSPQLQLAHSVLSVIAALLFFGGAFCAGQTLSLYFFSFFIVAITPASVPVLLFSLVAGLAAFSLYWCLESPGLRVLVSGWFGLSEEQIALISDPNLLSKQEKKLASLKERVLSASQLQERVSGPGPTSSAQKTCVDNENQESVTTNIYSFLRAPGSKSPQQDSALNLSSNQMLGAFS